MRGGGLLPEPEFRSYLFCNHIITDEPFCSQSVVAENDIVIRKYESNLKLCTLHREAKGRPVK